jgi:Osmosensitive K+ channel histidine kinase
MADDEQRRPDPDALLALAREEDRRKTRGRLRVFFGAAPGVGKTYSMLEEAFTKRSEGLDVLAGVVETHGRGETEALLAGIESLPRRELDYRGHVLREFDLDAALARKPALVLVDELAHANAPGGRHAKRWQDVRELLDNGIDVYTTLNVQHVESLNDVVAQITGVRVRETVPDSALEEADAVVLVDLPPDDLLRRLEEGKVYVPEQAEQAAHNFFRHANLTALRELALRHVAERVNAQVLVQRQGQAAQATWPTAERLLVCVGPSPSSAKLVRAAKRLAVSLRAPWLAVWVSSPQQSESEAVQAGAARNLRLAEQLGAEVVTLSGRRVAEEIVTLARSRNVTRIIIGKPLRPRWKDLLLGSPVDELVRLSGDIDVSVIRGDSGAAPEPAPPPAPLSRKREYAFSLGAWAVCTGLAFFMQPFFQLSNLIMVYLLGVVVVALRCGRGPSALASVLGVLTFDFFFVPPSLTLAVSDTEYFVTFGVMLVVALVISHLAAVARAQIRSARRSEARSSALLGLTRALAKTRGQQGILDTAVRQVTEVFECRAAILTPDPARGLALAATGDRDIHLAPKDIQVARWTLDNGQPAGAGTQTLPEAKALFLPLLGNQAVVGVLALQAANVERLLRPDRMLLLDSFARQIALSLELDRLESSAQETRVQAETERLRSALLSTVTHDLQTPLAAILGSAGSLLVLPADESTRDVRRELAENIHDEAERLSRLIANLLKMTSLESGALTVHKEPTSLEEVLGGVLNRLERKLAGRPLEVVLPPDLPLVPLDPLLTEQIFLNLLENSIKHTPGGVALRVAARLDGEWLAVEVADRGPGLPEEALDRVFDLFYRVPGGGQVHGHGLGLAICKALVLAHGGTVRARNREGGGALFELRLPLERNDA